MRCSWSMLTAFTLASALVGVQTTSANLLTNGGLELPSPPVLGTSPFLIVSAPTGNSLTLPGWTIFGNVDIVPASYWSVAQGSYDVDTIGSPGLGSIQQTVTGLTPGTTYNVSFDFGINPATYRGESVTTKQLQLTVTDPSSTIVATHLYQGTAGSATRLNMNYSVQVLNFIPDASTETITFAALLPLNLPIGETAADVAVGPVIDNVDLELGSGAPQTPEPATLTLLGIATFLVLPRRIARTR